MGQQLTLGISLGSDLNFESFQAGRNAAPLAELRSSAEGGSAFLYLWGEGGTGKTHLLHAYCRLAGEHGQTIGLLAGKEHASAPPALIEGWDRLDAVLIDDLQAFARRPEVPEWEEALFHLFNRLRDAGKSLIVTANRSPAGLEIALPDLKSRFGSMLTYQLQALDDDNRLAALQAKARQRGMELPDEAGRWLLARFSRDMHDLAATLDRLDHASLEAQRRLTIPFLRDVLGA